MDEAALDVSVDRARIDEGIVTVTLAGEIDPSTAGQLRSELSGALEEGSPDDLVLDLADVTFMDSSGVRVILEVLHQQQERSGGLTLTNVARSPLRVLEVSGLTGLIRSE